MHKCMVTKLKNKLFWVKLAPLGYITFIFTPFARKMIAVKKSVMIVKCERIIELMNWMLPVWLWVLWGQAEAKPPSNPQKTNCYIATSFSFKEWGIATLGYFYWLCDQHFWVVNENGPVSRLMLKIDPHSKLTTGCNRSKSHADYLSILTWDAPCEMNFWLSYTWD